MPGRIPAAFIDTLLARIDIVELIDAYVPLRKMGKDYKACCPFHEEKTPSFTVSQDKQFYHCFGCGAHGTAIGFLLEHERMDFREAIGELAKRAGLSLPESMPAAPGADAQAHIDRLLHVVQQANRYFQQQLREHPEAPVAVEYLKRRGVSGEIAARFQLGFAPDGWDGLLRAIGADRAAQEALAQAGLLIKKEGGGYYDRFRGRVMFPIHDYRGRIVGFGGRVLGTGEPKYLNSPETPLFHKGRELYGLFAAREAIKQQQRVLVVEGYMDVVALAQFGIDFAVAALGTATTHDHLERVFRHAPEVIFCFDGDRAGRDAAWRALENALPAMRSGRQASFLFLPDGEDPDTLVRKEGAAAFLRRLDDALPLPDFFFQSVAADIDLKRLDGRARLAEKARPLLETMAPGALKELMLTRLQEASGVGAGARTRAPASASAHRPRRGGAQAPPSLERAAVALLLQYPRLAADLPDLRDLMVLERPGLTLFIELASLLRAFPLLSTAAILERYRDTPHAPALNKLASWDYPRLLPDPADELNSLLKRLFLQAYNRLIDQLSNKKDLVGLTVADVATEMQRLYKERQKWADQPA